MIKVEKDLKKIPDSLNSKLTNQRRQEVIAAGEYPTLKKLKTNPAFTTATLEPYDSRYRYSDIKEQLAKHIYLHKCAFCEQRVEAYHVEHFRPKSIYYWLAYSWDNLLFCCPTCNSIKLKKFEVDKKVTITQFPIDNIHNLSNTYYDEYEKPSFVNPEKEDVYKHLVFKKDGSIKSDDQRVQHTITEIEIDRNDLNEFRFELYDEFEKKIASRIAEHRSGDSEAKIELKGYIKDFVKDSENPIKEFISFRKYIIKHWLNELVEELFSSNNDLLTT